MTDKIKIVFVLGKLETGGTERQFMETVRHLNRERFELRVLAFPSDGALKKDLESLHIPVICLGFTGLKGKLHPLSFFQLFHLTWNMVQFFRREKPHIVQVYLFWPNIYGSIAAKIARVPVIVTGRRGIVESQGMPCHYRWLRNLANRLSTAIVTNSSFVRQYCLEQEKYVLPETIHLIYNGIDVERFASPSKKNREKPLFNIPADVPVIGLIANLRPCKGLRDLLNAAAIVLQSYPHAVFWLIGKDGGIQHSLEILAHDLRIADSVIFTGERQDIPDLLTRIDVLVSSSLTESLSNTILEGMAAGKAIVATDVGGTSELVVHEYTGLLVPPANPEKLAHAILHLLDDQVLRSQLGKNSQQRVATLFPMERMIEQTEACYEKLLKNIVDKHNSRS